MKAISRVPILAAVVFIGFVGFAPGTAREAAIPQSLTAAPLADAAGDRPVLVAFDITPRTLKNNRINFLKLTFRFNDGGKNLLGGTLDIKLKYSNTSLPQAGSRTIAGPLPPLWNWPILWTYPLTQTVFNGATGAHTIYLNFLGETWNWVKITATLTDRAGRKSAARQVTFHRSTAVVGPKQGNRLNQLAYTFTLLNQTRRQIKLSSCVGKVVLLQFSYWNCPICQQEASHLEALYQKYKAQGFQPLTIMLKNVNEQPMLPEDCQSWASTFGLTTPVLADALAGVWDPYLRDTSGYSAPINILLDRTGKIRWICRGYKPSLQETKIKQLLAE